MRTYVFVLVFLAGASLMSLEMAGFRLAQPEFGSDIVVWGSLISVFLGGLSLGAFSGGRLADRRPSLWLLGGILGAAGLLALLMPLYSDGVFALFSPGRGMSVEALAGTAGEGQPIAVYEPPDMRWVTLGAGIALFFLPSYLLGMISPYSARLLIHRLPRLGTGVGMISGWSTLGSIVGTLGSTFYLIQLMGTRALIRLNGALLIAVGLGAVAVQLIAGGRQAPEQTAEPRA